MTTHEERTLTDAPEQPTTPVSEASRDEDAAVAPDAALDAGTVAPNADAPGAERKSSLHESSTAEALFADDDLADLRARWAGVQAAFVDDPQDCVQKADGLVSDLVEQLMSGFGQARSRLEEQWSHGGEASTEDLRLALMRYREFFERLLAV